MQAVDRSGVQFDMCPTCRGVWLDRGELEKLMASERQDAAPPPQPGQSPWGGGYDERRDHDDGRRYEKRDDYRHGGYRKKRDSIFDIFD
jgi:Zn-finger nucleic acid-binding protein